MFKMAKKKEAKKKEEMEMGYRPYIFFMLGFIRHNIQA